MFSAYGRLIKCRLRHSSCFSLNNCLLLLCSVSRIQSCCESGNFCHSSCYAARIGNALLFRFNNCLLLLFNNNLLLSRNSSVQESRIEGIHFSLERELLCRFGSRYCSCRLHHSSCFGLNECLLLLSSGSGIERSSECCNLSHSGSYTARVGNTLLFRLNDGVNLLFYNDLLQFGSLCSEKFCIESIHLGFECELFCGFAGRFNCNGSKHSNLFCLNNSLLLFGSGCSSESGIECSNFSHQLACSLIGLGKTLLFSLNNGLNFRLDDSILLSRSLCRLHSGIESCHFSFECELFSRFSSGLCNGLHHSLGFGLNNSLLLRSRGSSVESGSECCNFSHSGSDATRIGNTLLLRVNDSLCLLFDNYLLLCRSFSLSKLCIEGIHLSLKCELFSRFSSGLCNGLHDSLSFGLNDSLFLGNGGSSIESSGECSNFSHSGCHAAIGFSGFLLLSLNNCLCLLFNNDLLFLGSFRFCEFSIEGIHFSLKCKLFSRFSSGLCNGLHHSLSFSLNDSLLLGSVGSGIESSGESCNFSHSGCHTTGVGNTLLLRFNNCLLLLLDYNLLLCRSLSGCKFCIESIHFGLKCDLFSGFANRSNLCNRFGHCLCFGNDDSLLLFNGLCSSESGIESGNFCDCCIDLFIVLGNALFLSIHDNLLLLFNNSLLLSGRLCSRKSVIELVHFCLELGLFCSFCSLNRCGLCHCLLFGNDNCLLLFGSLCICKGSVKCGNLGSESGVIGITAGNALFLSLNDDLLLLFNNGLLLVECFCSGISSIELVHFSCQLSLLCGLCSTSLCGLGHCLLLCKDNSLLFFGGLCSIESGIECSNFGCELINVGNVCIVAALLCLDNGLLFSLDNSVLLFFGCSRLESGIQSVHFGFELNLLLGKNGSRLLGLDHSLLFGLDDRMLFSGSLSGCESGIESKDFGSDFLFGSTLCHALLLCLNNSLLLNLENVLLFFLGLCRSQSGVESVHLRLKLHLLSGLNVGLSGTKHCFLFSHDNSLLFCRSSCGLYCIVEFNNFSIHCRGSRGVGSKNLLFGFDDSLLFFGCLCSSKSGVESKNFCLNLSFLIVGGKSRARSTAYNDACGIICGSGCLKSLLLSNDFSLLFALDLSIDLRFGKSGLEILSLLGSLSSIHSHLQRKDIGLNSCHLCGTLVCLLLQLCSFLFSLLLFFDFELHLLAAGSGFSKAFTLIGEENLLGSDSRIVSDHRSYGYGIGIGVDVSTNNELVLVLFNKLGLDFSFCICFSHSFLITVKQHVLNTANDVGGVVDKVCNNLYGREFFRRHGDHIHLAFGGDGQKANGNNANTGSTATAKVFLSALRSGQIQATGCNTHGKLGDRNNHHAGGGNNLLTYNGVRINNVAYLIQRIADYFLDRRFVFHNE